MPVVSVCKGDIGFEFFRPIQSTKQSILYSSSEKTMLRAVCKIN